jgi:hypothetical protein
MNKLKHYLNIYGISLEEFLTIGFEEEEKIVLITKKDGTRIKYELKTEPDNIWKTLRTQLPDVLEFVGFQHSEEGNSFSTYTVLKGENK